MCRCFYLCIVCIALFTVKTHNRLSTSILYLYHPTVYSKVISYRYISCCSYRSTVYRCECTCSCTRTTNSRTIYRSTVYVCSGYIDRCKYVLLDCVVEFCSGNLLCSVGACIYNQENVICSCI